MQQVTSQPKTARLQTRVTQEQKELFLQAAALSGYQTLSDFIISTAYERATALVREHEVLLLTQPDRRILVDALLNPPAPNQKLRQAAQKYMTQNG